jgi:hypothetical protein
MNRSPNAGGGLKSGERAIKTRASRFRQLAPDSAVTLQAAITEREEFGRCGSKRRNS